MGGVKHEMLCLQTSCHPQKGRGQYGSGNLISRSRYNKVMANNLVMNDRWAEGEGGGVDGVKRGHRGSFKGKGV